MTRNFLITDLNVLTKYYDMARIVSTLPTNPLQPVIVTRSDEGSPYEGILCHCGSPRQLCQQCVCLDAVHCRETLVRVEEAEGKFYIITAIPVEISGQTQALELIKCVGEKALENFLIVPQKKSLMHHSVANLYNLAFRDALTNMYNRRYIDKQLPLEIAQVRQTKQPFSLIMTDIDYFKQVNDRYGHAVGDEVLKYFALQLKDNIRYNKGSWVARYGGEEFLIALTNCSEIQAYKITEKIRKTIERSAIPTSAGDLQITASFGVYMFTGQETDFHQLVDRVDKYLYQAKQSGRNRTVAATRQK